MNPQEPEQQNNDQQPTAPLVPTPEMPEQPPVEPQPTPLAPLTAAAPQIIEAPRKSHKKLALWLIIGPTALIILAIVLYAVINFIFSGQTDDGQLFGSDSPIRAILNILLFLCGAISVLTWLPGIIIGIVLLAKQSK